jgi:hypothetical protein
VHISTSQRFGELEKPEQAKLAEVHPNVPKDAHIVTGTLEANGAAELVSPIGEISAKIIKLQRTTSGGIDYQLAIFTEEPEPVLAPEPMTPEGTALTPEQTALLYFTEKGMPLATARAQVARFGVERINRMRDKELDDELSKGNFHTVPAHEQPGRPKILGDPTKGPSSVALNEEPIPTPGQSQESFLAASRSATTARVPDQRSPISTRRMDRNDATTSVGSTAQQQLDDAEVQKIVDENKSTETTHYPDKADQQK